MAKRCQALVLLGFCNAALLVTPARAFDSYILKGQPHSYITRVAASAEGWTEPTAELLAIEVRHVDLRESKWEPALVKHVFRFVPSKRYRPSHHFDRPTKLSSQTAFDSGCDYMRQVYGDLGRDPGDVALLRSRLGSLLHAIQDLVSHSNLIDFPESAAHDDAALDGLVRELTKARVADHCRCWDFPLRLTSYEAGWLDPARPSDPERFTHSEYALDDWNYNPYAFEMDSLQRTRFHRAAMLAVRLSRRLLVQARADFEARDPQTWASLRGIDRSISGVGARLGVIVRQDGTLAPLVSDGNGCSNYETASRLLRQLWQRRQVVLDSSAAFGPLTYYVEDVAGGVMTTALWHPRLGRIVRVTGVPLFDSSQAPLHKHLGLPIGDIRVVNLGKDRASVLFFERGSLWQKHGSMGWVELSGPLTQCMLRGAGVQAVQGELKVAEVVGAPDSIVAHPEGSEVRCSNGALFEVGSSATFLHGSALERWREWFVAGPLGLPVEPAIVWADGEAGIIPCSAGLLRWGKLNPQGRVSRATDLASTPYDEVRWTSSHNSYEATRHGVLVSVAGQLEAGVRSFECDLHWRGGWLVYHLAGRRMARPLSDYLKEFRDWLEAHPDSEPLTLWLEMKNPFNDNAGSMPTPGHLDRVLTRALGERLITPTCALKLRAEVQGMPAAGICLDSEGKVSIAQLEALRIAGWPSVKSMRGRMLVVIPNSWAWQSEQVREPLAGDRDQYRYWPNSADTLVRRAAFPGVDIPLGARWPSPSRKCAPHGVFANMSCAAATQDGRRLWAEGWVTRAWEAGRQEEWRTSRANLVQHIATNAIPGADAPRPWWKLLPPSTVEPLINADGTLRIP